MVSVDLICSAIRGHNLLRFYYYDDLPSYRVVEPYTLGYNRFEHLVLNGWFRSGDSISFDIAGLRDYRFEKINALEILTETFDLPRLGYVPLGGKKFETVLCDVSLN